MTLYENKFPATDRMLGKAVRDVDDEYVGEARELLIDVDEGRVAYLRIRLRSDLQPDNWYVTVPWSALDKPNAECRSLRLRVRAGTLAKLARQEADGTDL